MADVQLFNTYPVSAEALLPIHIGAGQENTIDPLEYVVKDGWFYRIDIEGMLAADLGFARQFTEAAEKEKQSLNLRKLFLDAFNPAEKREWLHRARAAGLFAEQYLAKLDDANNQLLVQCLPFSGHAPYIPGSSIKGALRTAILDRIASQKGYDKVRDAIMPPDGGRTGNLSRLSSEAEAWVVTGNKQMKPDEDPFRFVKVSDANLPPDSTEIMMVKNVVTGGQKKEPVGIDMFVEVVRPQTTFTFTISLATAEYMKKTGRDYPDLRETGRLCVAASEYLLGEPGNLGMEAETHYYNGKNNTAAAAVDAVFDDAEKHSGNERVTYLRVGRFSHLECMTFSDRPQNTMDKSRHLCQMSERTHNKGWGHTRNLVNGGIPLGVIRCELV